MVRCYTKVDDSKRNLLLEYAVIRNLMTIQEAAKMLDIKYGNAKKICRKYQVQVERAATQNKPISKSRSKPTLPLPTQNLLSYENEGSSLQEKEASPQLLKPLLS